MKKLTYLITGATLSASLMLPLSGAFAASFDAGTGVSAGNAVVTTGSLDGNSSGSANASADADVHMTLHIDRSHLTPESGTGEEGTGTVGAGTTTATAAAGAHMTASDITANGDLDTYARALLESDTHVEDVSAEATSVSVSYDEPARLFGLFPMLVAVRATANADGSVKINYPWYRFLMAADDTQLRAALAERVGAELGSAHADAATTTALMQGTLSANAKARLIEALHDILKSKLDASMSVTEAAGAETPR
jgi:hypothetical protein